jgi:hypothetical protein
VATLIKTCRSERKAEDNQQVVTNADQLLALSLSTLSSPFVAVCHYYCVFMTAISILEVCAHKNHLNSEGNSTSTVTSRATINEANPVKVR